MQHHLRSRTGWISFAAVLAGIVGVYNILSGLALLFELVGHADEVE